MSRTRTLLYVLLALAVPLPALALEGGSGSGGLDVHASLGTCGVADASIVCRIDTSFSRIENAEYYTAAVSAPDGSSSDLGIVAEGGGAGAGSAALWVRFAGDGGYTVTISAWGYDERGRPDVVSSDDADAEGEVKVEKKAELDAVEPPADAEEADPAPDAEEPPGEPGETEKAQECLEGATDVEPAGESVEAPAPAPAAPQAGESVEVAPDPCEQSGEETAPPPAP